MNVPIAAIRKMKRTFKDHVQMHHMMFLAKLSIKRSVVEAMWRGDFSSASLLDTEKFFLMLGYTVHVKSKTHEQEC